MSSGISEKDKKILYFVAAVAILAAAYFFGFRNFNDQTSDYKAKTKEYNDEYSELIELQKNRNEYINMTEKYKTDRAAILADYEEGFNQENLIKTLSDIETNSELWIKSMDNSEPVVVYEFTSEADLKGVENATEIEFEGDYNQFKKLLSEILAINSKTVIDTVDVKYKEDLQLIQGSIELKHYSLASDAEDFGEPEVSISLPTGVSNVFDSDAVVSNTQTSAASGSYILSDYDICTVINADDATLDAVIVGTTNDSKAKDSLSTDKNETAELTITVDGTAGKYTVSYKLGDDTYPAKNYEKGVSFEPGSTLDLLVVSSVRSSNNDKVGVKATLVNNSDMQLNVLVSGDDTSSPRFQVVSRTGDIKIYR
jgi:Tfp pilus assembly protein PilO